jgi:hypothetical protein
MIAGRGSPGLLVSVRSADEALAALAGGADLIDVKEPSRGPLGPADPDVIASIIAVVGGRVPVSAAMGEWVDWDRGRIPDGLAFVKWGLARARDQHAAAPSVFSAARGVAPVLVAYADHARADSPDPDELVRVACECRFPAFLIDTAIKDGATLLDWLAIESLTRMRGRLANAGVRLALAGSLDVQAIRRLASVEPAWFAVRGAACTGGRNGPICAERVRALKQVMVARRTPAAAS